VSSLLENFPAICVIHDNKEHIRPLTVLDALLVCHGLNILYNFFWSFFVNSLPERLGNTCERDLAQTVVADSNQISV
jgi:hypothetical protein